MKKTKVARTGVSAGTATVTVTARDPGGLSATRSASVTVQPANQAPVAVGEIAAQTITAGQSVTIDVSSHFSDPDGDALSYAATSSNAAVATATASGSSVTIGAVAVGTTTVTVTASDQSGLSATQNLSVTVEQANQAPVTRGQIPSQTVTEG